MEPTLVEKKIQPEKSKTRSAKRTIRKVAVLGSGIMGSRIACHFANIGVEVLLMDIVPKELSDAEKAKGLSLENKQVRNRVVNDSFQNAIKSSPAPLYHKSFASRIKLGNFEDNMKDIAAYDWVIEVVVENLKIKKIIYDQVEQFRKPGSLVTSNTSGIPIHLMAEGRSEDFQRHFCGTHFFNPPRYLKLLEIIPTQKTDQPVVDFLMHYGDLYLGKTTVLAKDTPAFIANRVGVYSLMRTLQIVEEMGLTVEEVDKLTGLVVGRPKSGTFRLSDIVGLDTTINVSNNLYEGLPTDESRNGFKLPTIVQKMQERKWLGDKTGQGFYRKIKTPEGQTEILSLDLNTFEYRPQQKARFETLESTKSIENVKDRFAVLLAGRDKAGEFYRRTFLDIFQYVSNRIPEIADELYRIDAAVSAGFAWEVGPFETWDAIGVKKVVQLMEETGKKPAAWVYEMLQCGHESFYKVEGGQKQYYDIPTKSYKAIPGTEEFIILDNLRGSGKKVWGNKGATLFDIGDGVLNLEFHTKMNTLGAEVVEGITKSISLAEKDFAGLVIGNDGANFSAGANLAMIFMYAIEQEYDEIDFMIRQFQNTIMRVRYSAIPVVVAPHGMTLGGGCEMVMHADRVQAAAETYMGLVEVGVGLIPGGGGTKEMTLRVSDRIEAGDVELNALQNTFMNIAQAKVSTSAQEAFDLDILRRGDQITLNRSRLIADAKTAVLDLVEQGYTQPLPRKDIKVQGKTGMALFKTGIYGMLTGRYISEHDAKIANKIAYVMCGGDLSYPQLVSEQYLLDLEREAFLSLTGEKKTLERIQSILQGGKPLRN
ncbi:3-hydroxyacyl-CoA dehydrogenase/enoyl-CoA hydratase family protein [Rhodocytophaga aerolata]|uniref:3-hydroxyacyl-CoA dehydrogenase/enoyl-CoA hydratase family protein n=1 Tax=Rhodocytophaga aerolata TaxID=455078 RepID=A0ABT8R4M0_9BACT|nr:3-hydroxyacyl-CoA dehydrogenase/enoyl-CoA hydratase family protein [Rhodocytophaga aerolata]MDO1446243.1 3-hydroxyacyl-CoA dehydrogenase/enoyl-CoA hydratase family protein [Rhodocytophaga aerolata]